MSRVALAVPGLLLLALMVHPDGSSSPATPLPPASVKLWVDTTPDDPCETGSPASGDWTIRNNEGRNVHIVLRRSTIQNGTTTQDEMKDTIGPHEVRALGCEMWHGGSQSLSVVSASF